ncbi:MAG: hypothetical protein K0R66_642 [Gammaproteobacteria bacterium]|jgi:hypothetical protein|nr:hypothetical protein [Gammaproteobacteria bacterium]
MKKLLNIFIVISLGLLMVTGQSFAASANQVVSPNPIPLKQMEQLKFDSASASSFSIQSLNLKVPTQPQENPATDLVAMWKTPIPNLSIGYTVGNVSVNPNNSIQLNNNLNNSAFNAVAIQFTGF